MERAEAWNRKKHGVVLSMRRSMEQNYGAEAWSRCVEQKETWIMQQH
jgi:hypothetical protein